MEASPIGFGTYQLKGQECYDAVKCAIETGYTLIDSATVYKNEEQIGKVLKDTNTRNSLFITSKLAPADQGYDSCMAAVELSLKKMEQTQLDLYLIHWPGTSKLQPSDPNNHKNRSNSYKALESCKNEGKVRYIGVSNYTMTHLRQLLEECSIKPYLIQNECHPLYYDHDLIDYCKENKIIYQAYSSFGGSGNMNLVNHFSDHYIGDKVESITKKHSKSLPQVLLKWALEKGLYIIPKATSKAHIKANFDLNFHLDDKDMNQLDRLKDDYPNKFSWDPESIQ